MRQQVGALPIRWTGDEPRVLLVTSRETQRWIIPKGWRMRGLSNADAAAQEAFEEAGVRGRVRPKPIGRYKYAKRIADGFEDCKITTYLLEVTDELDTFPEMAERQRAWFTIADATACADDEGLRGILRELGPRLEGMRAGDHKLARRRAKAAERKTTAGKAAAGKAEGGEPSAGKRSVSEVHAGEAGAFIVPAADEAPAGASSPDETGPEGARAEAPPRKRRAGKSGSGKAGSGKSASGKSGSAKAGSGKPAKAKAPRQALAVGGAEAAE